MPVPTFYAPTAIDPIRNSLQMYLEESVLEGAEFSPGQTIEFGWSVLKVAGPPSDPYVTAPILGHVPMEFSHDCSDALMATMQQRYICDSFQVAPCQCSALQSALVIQDFHDCRNRFMDRLDPASGNSSGWFFGAYDSKCDPDDVKNLELKSLWETICDLPMCREFMFLPVGWQVMLDDGPSVLRDHAVVEPGADSYFSTKYLRKR